MTVARRTRLAWRVIELLEGGSVMQQPPERILRARRRRQRMSRLPGGWLLTGRPDARARIEPGELRLDDGTVLPIRTYRPKDAGRGPLPVVVNFHGGGWVSGDPYQSEWWCAGVAAKAGVVVVSVDYRLAPEYRFPVPAEDCYAATAWVVANATSLNVDPERVAVMGDSAGGNLAAAVCLMARDRGGPAIALQVLIYPSVDLAHRLPSETENANGPVLYKADLENTPRVYLRDVEADATNPYVSPLLGDAGGLPPAIIQTAQHDPLRDHGPAYAEHLRASGVEVRLTNYADGVHGYISLPGIVPVAAEALEDAAREIREMLKA
ncbi:MAG: alpha/beta hydrolase [Jatrophihabitans sp.]|uniref:alpha/beta hydrolase n=1 Tax=Jatrophihabitans sp. TaxID=1932789 RepID=UPI003F7CD4F0